MTLTELVKQSRSCRRFYEDRRVTAEQLTALVNLGRLSPSGGNKQYIKYAISHTEEKNAAIYECLAWAGYYKDWDGPDKGERPSGYIILLRDKAISDVMSVDEGISAQSIFLGAAEMGLGGCMLMNVNRKKLMEALKLNPEQYSVSMVIALGVPKEEVRIVPVGEDGDIKYYRDANGVHNVPKRELRDVLIDR